MNLDEAFLYLGIDSKKDISLDEIEENYNTKKSLYEISRFKPNTPEFEEAQKMSECIETAYDCIIDSLAEFYDEEKHEISKNNFYKKIRFVNSHFLFSCVIGAIAVGLLIFAVFISFSGNKISVQQKNSEQNISRENNNSPDDIRNIVNIALQEYEKNEKYEKQNQQKQQNNNSNSINYAELAEKVMPSMVKIEAYIGTEEKRGSGFFVSSKGDILTNYHVIGDSESIKVTLSNSSETYALVKDYDKEKDIALLTVNLPGATPFLKISSKLPKQGEAVMAVGNPRGLEGTVSNGIVSAFRDNNTWIQFTAPISQGSSGGALINSLGEVVGMPTMVRIDGQNLNFAISPIILSRFFNSAKNKTPREMQKIASRKAESVSPLKNLPGLVLVEKDENYEMYLDKESINYDKESSRAYFMTILYPSEKMKQKIKKDPNFNLLPNKNLKMFIISYIVDFSNNTYARLITINFYDDDSTETDYKNGETMFTQPPKGSRIEHLMQVVYKQISIQSNKYSNHNSNSIRLPDKNGFLVHKWGSSIESVRKNSLLLPLEGVERSEFDKSYAFFSTIKLYRIKEFSPKIIFSVTYDFTNDKLNSINFLPLRLNYSLDDTLYHITKVLSNLYGSYTEQIDGNPDLSNNVAIQRMWNNKGIKIWLMYHPGLELLSFSFTTLNLK